MLYSNSSATAVNTTATPSEYKFNVGHTSLLNAPVRSGGNTTLRFHLINDTTATSPDTFDFNVTAQTEAGRTVYYVDGANAGEDGALTLDSDGLTIPVVDYALSVDDKATYDKEDVPINGSGSNVTVHFANSTAQSALDTKVGDLAAAGWAKGVTMQADDNPVRAYVDEAPDDVDDESSYAVINTNDNDIRLHTGDDFEDEDEIDSLSVTANAGFMEQFEVYGLGLSGLDTSSFSLFSSGSVMSFSGLFLFFGGRRRDEEQAS